MSTMLSNSVLFDEKELADLERIHADIKSKSSTGHVDKSTLMKIFPPGMPEFLLDRIFAIFDDNLDGFIDSKEFTCGLSPFCKGSEEEKLSFWFKIFDVDRDGKLSDTELLAMMTSLWKVAALKSDFEEDCVVVEEGEGVAGEEGTLRASAHMDEDEERFQLKMTALVKQAFLQFDIEDKHMTLEHFKMWVSSSQLAKQFLEMITRMSNICFGLRPVSGKEEKDIVDELLETEEAMKAGDTMYVLSARWWNSWKVS